MDHRKVLQAQITLSSSLAVASAVLIIVGPELLLIVLLPRFVPAFSSAHGLLIALVVALIPLALIAVFVYYRFMLNAALYATLLNIDENLEKLAGKLRQ